MTDKRFQNNWDKPTNWLRRMLMRKQKGLCLDCLVPDYDFDMALQVHRVTENGKYSLGNCVLLCFSCHRGRHGR